MNKESRFRREVEVVVLRKETFKEEKGPRNSAVGGAA